MLHCASHTEIIGRITLASSEALSAVGVARKIDSTLTIAENVTVLTSQASSRSAVSTRIEAFYSDFISVIIFNKFKSLVSLNTISINITITPLIPQTKLEKEPSP